MTGRLLIVLHWSTLLLLLALIKGGTQAPALRWAFVAITGAWLILTLLKGLRARPGPKLTGLFRAGFRAAHWAMIALVAAASGLTALALLGLTPLDWSWNALLVLLVASIFHGIFHLWRHTALNDGALRMMTPKIWHKHL